MTSREQIIAEGLKPIKEDLDSGHEIDFEAARQRVWEILDWWWFEEKKTEKHPKGLMLVFLKSIFYRAREDENKRGDPRVLKKVVENVQSGGPDSLDQAQTWAKQLKKVGWYPYPDSYG